MFALCRPFPPHVYLLVNPKQLHPWSQQARQLTPPRGTVAHVENQGVSCWVHSHGDDTRGEGRRIKHLSDEGSLSPPCPPSVSIETRPIEANDNEYGGSTC